MRSRAQTLRLAFEVELAKFPEMTARRERFSLALPTLRRLLPLRDATQYANRTPVQLAAAAGNEDDSRMRPLERATLQLEGREQPVLLKQFASSSASQARPGPRT